MKLNNILGFTAIAATLVACATNPMTGRKSLQLASNDQIATMALQQYKETLSKAKVISGTASATQVKSVGMRIKNAANNYYKSVGREADIANYQWEFNLVDDKQVNAWCMPGGKVVVYTGLLPVTQDETGLAVVMGHEVSHALAGHGNERISQQMVAQYGGALLGAGASMTGSQWSQVFNQVYPIGSQVVLLKYGRNQELEADKMGLYLMAMSGYDPRQALPFWERMDKVGTSSSRPPEFLSTHPNPENRRADIEKWLPDALKHYQAAGGKL